MAQVQITVEVPDEIIERAREWVAVSETGADADATDDLLWYDAETAVIDAIRATFSPADLVS